MTLQQLRYVIEVAETGSINEAAKKLFISQPNLSMSIKDLEKSVHINIFDRTTKGVVITAEGEEFLGYARQIINQVELLEDRYIDPSKIKKKFGVSAQHYSFAVKAFVEMVKGFDMKQYEFAMREARTHDVIHDVVTGKSEIGILYISEFNERVLGKIFKDNKLEFTNLFSCNGYAYLWKNHPLAKREVVSVSELREYPCLSFEQGDNNSFYFAEEILSTYDFTKIIKSNDRATNLNLMVGLNAFTLCSGIICEELNGSDFVAVRLSEEISMNIGYIKRAYIELSSIGKLYIDEIKKYVSGYIEIS